MVLSCESVLLVFCQGSAPITRKGQKIKKIEEDGARRGDEGKPNKVSLWLLFVKTKTFLLLPSLLLLIFGVVLDIVNVVVRCCVVDAIDVVVNR